MKQRKLISLWFGSALLVLGLNCNAGNRVGNIAEKQTAEFQLTKQIASDLVDRLSRGQQIGALMSDTIDFVYHADNRCDGSSDGTITKLSGTDIDKPFKIKVTTDGNGWACKKKEPTQRQFEFQLHEQISEWDHIEFSAKGHDSNIIYIAGGGESDYMIFHIKHLRDKSAIYKVEYRSEDPG